MRTSAPKFLEQFLNVEAASGLALLGAAVVALLWANSPWSASYHHLWEIPLGIGFGRYAFSEPLHFWINDGLMTFFFLLVGLEIRRELHDGTLADHRRAMLPLMAALGGVALPALLYLAFNVQSGHWRGWAVPTATDIAFAVGVLGLLARSVPASLRVLLLAIAIIDDIIAILVIALFYSHGIRLTGLAIAAGAAAAFMAVSRPRTGSLIVSGILGLILWAGLLWAGVHPALAGVITGLLAPVSQARQAERALHTWVAFGVVPLFALANAGVSFSGLSFVTDQALPLMAGIVAGLVIGKPVGIVMATALSVRLGWCSLPADIDLKRVAVIGCLAGIGFTMSIFISYLAFEDEATLASAKLAILIGSAVAAIAGLITGHAVLSVRARPVPVGARDGMHERRD